MGESPIGAYGCSLKVIHKSKVLKRFLSKSLLLKETRTYFYRQAYHPFKINFLQPLCIGYSLIDDYEDSDLLLWLIMGKIQESASRRTNLFVKMFVV